MGTSAAGPEAQSRQLTLRARVRPRRTSTMQLPVDPPPLTQPPFRNPAAGQPSWRACSPWVPVRVAACRRDDLRDAQVADTCFRRISATRGSVAGASSGRDGRQEAPVTARGGIARAAMTPRGGVSRAMSHSVLTRATAPVCHFHRVSRANLAQYAITHGDPLYPKLGLVR